MFWDTRQPPQKVSGKTINQSKLNTDQPFHYLDLTWKPFIKVEYSLVIVLVNCLNKLLLFWRYDCLLLLARDHWVIEQLAE